MEALVREDVEICRVVTADLKRDGHPTHGSDNAGVEYDSLEDMWISLGVLPKTAAATATDDGEDGVDVDDSSSSSSYYWYEHSADYYDDDELCPPTVGGMLGGFASVSDVDLAGSRAFLRDLAASRPSLRFDRCCDCGAGVGRVTRGLLLPLGFSSVTLVDGSARLLDVARAAIEDDQTSSSSVSVRYARSGLQDHAFDDDGGDGCGRGLFDVVWIQWVVGYLTDGDLVRFLRRCGRSLRTGGVVCLKDNTSGTDEAFQLDRSDSFLTRSLPWIESLATQAGLTRVRCETQKDFPEEIYPVPMLAYEFIENEEKS